MSKCSAKTKGGKSCRAQALTGRAYCLFHAQKAKIVQRRMRKK